jgi:predicted small secreted protein
VLHDGSDSRNQADRLFARDASDEMRRDSMSFIMKVILWWLLTALGISVVGCHTVHGAGEDITGAGHAIERAAD